MQIPRIPHWMLYKTVCIGNQWESRMTFLIVFAMDPQFNSELIHHFNSESKFQFISYSVQTSILFGMVLSVFLSFKITVHRKNDDPSDFNGLVMLISFAHTHTHMHHEICSYLDVELSFLSAISSVNNHSVEPVNENHPFSLSIRFECALLFELSLLFYRWQEQKQNFNCVWFNFIHFQWIFSFDLWIKNLNVLLFKKSFILFPSRRDETEKQKIYYVLNVFRLSDKKKLYVLHCLDEISHFVELGFNNCNSINSKRKKKNELT